MVEIQPVSLNTVIGANQQTLVDSPLFRSLFRDINNKQSVIESNTTQTPLSASETITNQAINYQLLPANLAPVTLFSLPKGTRFTAQEIAQLIYKINPQGITLTALRAYPNSDLTPLEQQIRDYFVSSPIVFESLARLDNNNKALSNQDIQVASQIVRNLNTTPSTPQPIPLTQRPLSVSTAEAQTTQATVETPVINRTEVLPTTPQQAPVTPQQTPQIPTVNPNAARQPVPVQNQNAVPLDLSKNERVRAYAGYNAMPARRKRRGDDVESPDIETVLIDDPEAVSPVIAPSLSYVKPFFVYTEKIELDASEVKELFEKIAGEKKKLTLFNIRNYEPANAKEDKIISVLKHLNVYKELSHINHHEDLELEDIEIATDGKDFVFSDGRLDLIIHSENSHH